MPSVDERIVGMKFDNKQFASGAQQTLGILDRLKAALSFKGASQGLSNVQTAANRFSLAGMANAATGIGGKFSAMSVAAIAAIASITTKAVDAGIRIAKAFTLEPLKQGFQEYETGLNSVQTILANTQASGAKLGDVNRVLRELNTYSDQTIYNFAEMARNIGTFTAAGVDLKTSAMSIKGIANLAALSGSNSQQASSAMYQLSQAISAGRVSLQDWNSVVNAGMGGTVFQRALAQTAEKMGTLDKGAVKLTGKMKNVSIAGKSFRESITAKPGEESWLTSKVLTETLKQFTGDMSDAELASMGFTKAQIKNIQEQAKTAKNAATEVKTFTQLVGTLQEAAGSGWAQTFQILVGDFKEAKKLWTEVNNVIGGAIGDSAKARNDMLQDWKDLGGRTKLISGLRNIFAALVAVITPIKQAFREIFPATTGKQLYAMTLAFVAFTKQLKIGAGTAGLVKRTFAGIFAIFSIGWSLVKALAGVLGDLFGIVLDGSGSFLSVTAGIGDWLVALDKSIKKGQVFQKFFTTIGNVLKDIVGFFRTVGSAIVDMFKGFQVGGIAEGLGRIKDRLAPLASTGDLVSKAWDKLLGLLGRTGDILAPLGNAIGGALSGIGDAIAKAFKAGDFNSVYDALNTGLLTGIVLLIKKFLGEGLKIDFGGGLGASIKETFGALTDTLSAMQAQIQAKTLMTIAAAIGILTVSIVALSLIDSAALTKSLAAMAVAFGQLMVAMAILTKISGAGGFAKIPVIAAGMVLLATAVVILTAAVKNLSGLDWNGLAKGLIGVGALLGMIAGVSTVLQKSSGSILRAGIAMIPLAIGLKILASVVKDFATMSFGDIGKGLLTIAGALVVIAAGMSIMPPSMIATAAGLVLVGVALKIMASAFSDFGGMSWGEIAKSMVVLAGSLLILAGGLYLMTAALPGAAALVVVALALAVLAPVLILMASMSWEEIGKGMVVLAGSLLILAGGLYLMTAAAAGAGALVLVAAALSVLAPVLILLGTMSWQAIATGLGAIAGVFLVLGIAGLVLAPIVPIILALSAALLLLGLATVLVGVGLLAIATAFSVFVAAATAGVAVVTAMINLIPAFMTKFAEGIGAFATSIAQQATKFTKAFTSLLNSLLDAIIKVAPKIGRAFNVIMNTLLNILITNIPKIAATGVRLILGLANALIQNMPRIVTAGARIITSFLTELGKHVPKITRVGVDLILKFMSAIQSQQGRLLAKGADLIIDFVRKLASTIRSRSSAMRSAGRELASAIASGMSGGLSDKIGSLASAAARMARAALNAAKSALGINSPSREFFMLGKWSNKGLANGLIAFIKFAVNAGENVADETLSAMRDKFFDIRNMLPDVVSFNPRITPVLDLSKISQDARAISGIIGTPTIGANVSYGQASDISLSRQNRDDSGDDTTGGGNITYEFKQENYSPKALSTAEVYRNTKNLFSLTVERLKV